MNLARSVDGKVLCDKLDKPRVSTEKLRAKLPFFSWQDPGRRRSVQPGHLSFLPDAIMTTSMITTATWVPRGFAAPFPSKYKFDEDEFERIAELAKLQLDDAKEDLEEAEKAAGGAEEEEEVKADKSEKKEKKSKKSEKEEEPEDEDNELVQRFRVLAWYKHTDLVAALT